MLPDPKQMIAWTIYITFAGALGLLFMPRFFARWIALATALAGFVTSLLAFFDAHDVRRLPRSSAIPGSRSGNGITISPPMASASPWRS